MEFPLTYWYISIWLAVTTIILFVTAQLISPYNGRNNLAIDKKRLRKVSLVTGTLSLATFLIRIYYLIA
jgi:uncharacterized membrane protein YhaH (DUF805 family)